MRHVRFEIADRSIERLRRRRRFRGKEFERKRRGIRPHDIGNVHQSRSIFVRAAPFGHAPKNSKSTSWRLLPTAAQVNLIATVESRIHAPEIRSRLSVL